MLLEHEQGKSNERNLRMDMLKAICMWLICYSYYNSFNFASNTSLDYNFFLEYCLLTLAAVGVPIFLLTNGAYMLNSKCTIKKIIRKTLVLLFITVFWTHIYVYGFSLIFHENKTFADYLHNIYDGIYAGEYISIRNLFFFTIVVIYMFVPVLNYLFALNNDGLIIYILLICFVFTIGNDCWSKCLFVAGQLFGRDFGYYSTLLKRINIFSNWDSFALTYFLVGGMIYKYRFSKRFLNFKRSLFFFPLVFLVIYVAMVGWGWWYRNYINFSPTYSNYSTLLCFSASLTLFIWFIDVSDYKMCLAPAIEHLVTSVSKDSTGIYFIHLFIGTITKPIYLKWQIHDNFFIGIIYASTIFLSSFVICELIKKIPIVKHIVTV